MYHKQQIEVNSLYFPYIELNLKTPTKLHEATHPLLLLVSRSQH